MATTAAESPSPTTASDPEQAQGMPLLTLSAMVVGSMVGAGVFFLPRNFAMATGVVGALVAWAIAGVGMLMLAFVFQNLAVRRPDLDAGVYAYAKAGFGEYPGFFSAFGFWASACVGNVTYWVLIKTTLSPLIPAFGEGNTYWAVGISTLFIWAFHFMVLRGVRQAAFINKVVTVAKVLPILTFIIVLLFYFKPSVFRENLWGYTGGENLFGQVQQTMLVTVFVFLGIEGASVYSRYARRREDVGKATVLGFLSVLAIFCSVTMVAYGILPRSDLSGLSQPSMAPVFEEAVGRWGLWFISIGLIVSVLGAYLAWTLMAAEVLYMAAKDDDMPRALARTNDKKVPWVSLLMTSALVQVVLITTLWSDDALDFTLKLCSSLALIPYLLAAGYALQLSWPTRDQSPRHAKVGRGGRAFVIALLATIYTLFLVIAAGLEFIVLSFVIYLPGTLLFIKARKEQGRKPFVGWEWALLALSVVLAVFSVIALATGWITI